MEWRNRTDFAHVAEALGVTTDSIMSAGRPEGGETWVVLYTDTPTSDPDEWVNVAILRPDARGILQVVRRSPHKTIGELHAELAAHLERELGPPEGRDDGAV